MNVELPDGSVIEDVPEGTTRKQLAEKLKANGRDVPAEWLQEAPAPATRKSPQQMAQEASRDELMRKAGVGEAVLSMGTGLAGQIVGGLAGGVAAMLPGEEGQGARVSQRVSDAMTYQPRTDYGKRDVDIISKPFQLFQEYVGNRAGEAVTDATGSPALGTATNVGLNMLPAIVSRGARGQVAKGMEKVADATKRNALADDTLRRAQAEGYKVEADTPLGKVATSIGGKPATAQEMTVHNQEITNKIARREAGLSENQPITEGNLRQARDRMAAPYRKVAAMSPIAERWLKNLQQVRHDAKEAWTSYNRNPDPKMKTRAQRMDEAAERLEDKIDRMAAGSKDPYLIDELRAARKALAKNYQVEKAVNKGTGDVDARYLGNRLDAGEKMSGGLETIARFAQGPGFRVTRDASRIPMTGATHDMALESLIGGIEGARHFGLKGALVGGGMPLLRGPARSLAMSKYGQPGPTAPGLGLKLGDIATRPAATGALALTPALGLKVPREESQ